MAKFVSNTKNCYAAKTKEDGNHRLNRGQFVSKCNVDAVYMIRNNTANITGRKVTFKHV